jgi:hypothetical protein
MFVRILPCLKAETYSNFEGHLTVVIRKFEKTEGGMFQQDYVNYCVETVEQNWSVMRRYNEFVWLRDTLEKMHPGLPVRII